MADIKWSAFPSTASAAASGDTLVGLHIGANYQFGVTATPTSLAIAQWDINSNLSANNLLPGFATTATAGANTILTVASKNTQEFTGSTTQTVTMPVTSTLVAGFPFKIINNSSGIVTINSSGGNVIQAMAANTSALLTCVSTSGTSAASWNATYISDGAGVLSITGTANQIIASSGTGNVTLSAPQDIATISSPTFAALTLTAPLTVANGGSGRATATAYALLAAGTTATGIQQSLGTGNTGQLLQSNGAAALPTWTTATFPSGSGTLNHMLRSDGTNWVQTTNTTLTSGDVLAGVTSATIGDINIAGSTLISTSTNENITITPNGSGEVLLGIGTPVNVSAGFFTQITNNLSTGNSLLVASFDNLPVSGAIYGALKSRSTVVNSFVALQTNDVIGGFVGYGDTGFTYRSCGGMILACAASPSSGIMPTQLTLSTQNAAGSTTTALTISDAQIVTLANALPVGSGGLGITTTPSNGFIPIGNGTNYVSSAITPGAGISVTNGAGTITIASTASGLTWSGVAGTTQAAAVNSGYIIQNASQTTVTLPVTAAIGSTIAIQGLGAAGWVLAAGVGQTIKLGSATTTSGGSLTSAAQYDTVQVVCIVANTTWSVSFTLSTGLTLA